MKIFDSAVILIVLSILACVSPCSDARGGSMTPTERQVTQIADQYVAARYPDFDTVKYPPVVYDKGDAWEVEYELNPTDGTQVVVIGGTPVVVIDKITLRVLHSYRTQ